MLSYRSQCQCNSSSSLILRSSFYPRAAPMISLSWWPIFCPPHSPHCRRPISPRIPTCSQLKENDINSASQRQSLTQCISDARCTQLPKKSGSVATGWPFKSSVLLMLSPFHFLLAKIDLRFERSLLLWTSKREFYYRVYNVSIF